MEQRQVPNLDPVFATENKSSRKRQAEEIVPRRMKIRLPFSMEVFVKCTFYEQEWSIDLTNTFLHAVVDNDASMANQLKSLTGASGHFGKATIGNESLIREGVQEGNNIRLVLNCQWN